MHTDLRALLNAADPETLARESLGLAALLVVILAGLFLPALA
jgi:hypothetical protein